MTVEACEWAGCTRITTGSADGWVFCRTHLREHRQLKRQDVVTARARGPRPLPPPDPALWLRARYGGELRPCRSWQPLLDVMNNPYRRQEAS